MTKLATSVASFLKRGKKVSECLFCQLTRASWISESEHFYVVWDIDPIQDGHMLLISKQHRRSLQALSAEEAADLLVLQQQLLEKVEQIDDWGGTLAINNGKLMDEGTHFHCHLIPRFKDDGFWDKVAPQGRRFDKASFLRDLYD